MQMQKVETIAGNAISPAPFRIPSSNSSPDARWRSTFSIVTVASSTRLPNDVFLRDIAITHLCHVAYMTHSAAHHFDRQIVQQIDPWRIDVEINRHFFSADLGRAAWIGKRAIADGSDDIGFDEVVGFQRLEVEIDRNHPLFSAIWVGNADSGHTDQSDANLV